MSDICTCGRDYSHCFICGAKNPYWQQKESMKLSLKLGRQVSQFRCQRGHESNDGEPCTAPELAKKPEFKPGSPKAKPVDNRPQFTLAPKTNEYQLAAIEEYNNRATSAKYKSPLDIITSMLKDGWVDYTTWEFDPVTKEYIDPSNESITEPDPAPQEDSPTELTLEQVIERMKEEQK
jgi:hypothetical protein